MFKKSKVLFLEMDVEETDAIVIAIAQYSEGKAFSNLTFNITFRTLLSH